MCDNEQCKCVYILIGLGGYKLVICYMPGAGWMDVLMLCDYVTCLWQTVKMSLWDNKGCLSIYYLSDLLGNHKEVLDRQTGI